MVPAPDWWRTWFGPGYLALYDEVLAARTPGEVDGLERLLDLRRPNRILDLACGQGRHAIELARRGHSLTGLDLSPFLLEVASKRALAAGLEIRWVEGDMRVPIADQAFDVVLSLFTSFGYFAERAADRLVLASGARMLRPGGRLVLELLNGDRELADFQSRQWFTVGDAAVMEDRRLDRSSRRLTVHRTVARSDASEASVHAISLYTAAEIVDMLSSAGFADLRVYGDWTGEPFNPQRSGRLIAVGTIGA